jgi:predicted permease
MTEMALSAMLLVGAALLVRSVSKLERVDPGFPTADLYSVTLSLPTTRYNPASEAAFVRQIQDGVKQIGGVKTIAVASSAPPNNGYIIAAIEAEGSDYGKRAPGAIAMNNVQPEYFSTVGLPMIAGTTFTAGASDRSDLIINEGFAQKLWPGQSAVGRHIRFPGPAGSPPATWQTVVGVVGNVITTASTHDRDAPLFYFPMNDREGGSKTILFRVSPGFDPVAPVRQLVAAADPRLPPVPVQSATSRLASTFATQRFTMQLLAAFAGLAVLLSGIGLYGVIAYVVTQRQREIGVRIALGATPAHVARLIVVRGLVVSTVGLAIGLTAATWGSSLVQSALYGVTGTDPVSYAAAAALLSGVAVLACVVPMRRAMAVDPAIAMRGD